MMEVAILVILALILILYVSYKHFFKEKTTEKPKKKKSKKKKSDDDEEGEDDDDEEEKEESIEKKARRLYKQCHSRFVNGLGESEFLKLTGEDGMTYMSLKQIYNSFENQKISPNNITVKHYINELSD